MCFCTLYEEFHNKLSQGVQYDYTMSNKLSRHLYDLHVVHSPACQCGFDFEDINHFFFNCPLFGAERTELLTNLLTLGITDVNLSLLLIGCDDYDEELNKDVFKFVHHFIDSTGRL